jgi:hypothetical protein
LYEIAGYLASQLDAHGFPREEEPEDSHGIRSPAREQIDDELRITMSIKRALHEEQY